MRLLTNLFLSLLLGLPATALAQPAPDQLGGLKFRHIGPVGNRTLAVTGVPGDRHVYYAGAATGGIWKTEDAGLKWRPVFDDQDVHAIGALAVADSDPNIVWAGTGETFIRANVSIGIGVFKSTDAGRDLGAHGPRRDGADRADHHPPHEPGHRLRGVARPRLLPPGRTRGLPHDGRGRNLGKSPLRGRGNRRLGHGHGPEQPADPLCRHVAACAPDLGPDERRAGKWALGDPGRRRHLDRIGGERASPCRTSARSRSA